MGAQFTLGRITEALGATLEGDPARVILGAAPLGITGPESVSPPVNPRSGRATVRSRASIDDLVQGGRSCNVGKVVVPQEIEDGRHA